LILSATTNGAAKYRDILKEKSASVVIVEEAGEVLEPHILTSLTEESFYSKETKHLILIGDHLQLRPKVECYELSTASQHGYNFDISLFERLIKGNFPSTMLRVQHRMRPYISNFIRQQTYPTLIDHPSVTEFDNVKGVPLNVAFITHSNPEFGRDRVDKDRKTKSNKWEASMCIEVVRYLLLQGYHHNQITILTPYVGQVIEILNVMRNTMKDTSAYVSELDQSEMDHFQHDLDVESTDKQKAIRCSSIDNFQGEECDIIVVSLVRSNLSGDIGFLKEAQRVNVLLSRAKLGLYMIGNADTLLKSAKGMHVWDPVIKTLQNDNALLQGFPTLCQLHPEDAIIHISDYTKFREFCPNGT
jgi:superfamily I DNA and/or RNA helicase